MTTAHIATTAPKRKAAVTWALRAFNLIVVGAMTLALIDTISFLSHLTLAG
jgi:hypothetical protein